MSSNSAVRSQITPLASMPGPAKMMGTRQERSHKVNFRQWSFSPNCQPWSLHKTTIVLPAWGPLSSASITRPTLASAKLTQARYAATARFHCPDEVTLSWSRKLRSDVALLIADFGTSARSFSK